MSSIQYLHQKRSLAKKLRKAILTTTLITSSPLLYGVPAMAAIAPAGQVIQNKATGSFIDIDNAEKAIFSNTVQVTVAEVTGISITPSGTTGTPTLGSIVYFDFTISNDGNDPTQFFIPGSPSAASGGTPGLITVISYDPDGVAGASPAIDLTAATPSGTPVTVPITGAATGTLTKASAFNNGSIPAGGTITVRVPMTVTTTGGQSVSVTLGDTPAAPNNNNQDYSTTTSGLKDLYTQDNSGTNDGDLVSGPPFNGDSTLHRKEASATSSINAVPSISGVVFEDVNYGGGSGRAVNAPGTAPRSNATVELYKSDGTFFATTTTNGSGAYAFTNTPTGDYIVRVVNSTVTSSRSGYVAGLLPVQTFRTNAGTTAGVVNPVVDRVGGEKPVEEDAPANNGSQTLADLNALTGKEVQSLTAVKMGTTDVNDIDFGYNFDTIVNTNDSGQGSLRQFILNSNALTNAGLDQVANPNPAPGTTAVDPATGVETSIFMIPVSGLNANGVAVITPTTTQTLTPPDTTAATVVTTTFPIISDAYTAIDGRTQTINIGNTNTAANLGDTSTIVGVNGTALTGVASPEIELAGNSSTIQNFLLVNGDHTTIRNIAISATSNAGPIGVLGTIRILPKGTNTQILENAIGVISAVNGGPGGGYYAAIFNEANNVTVNSNLLRGTGETVYNRESITGWTITNNEISTSTLTGKSGNACLNFSNGSNTLGPQNAFVQRNFMHDCSWGIQADSSNAMGAQFLNNTFKDNAVSGILITYGEKDHLIMNNIITGNASGGIVIEKNVTGVKISQNSIFGNGGPGIDLSSREGAYNGAESISPNDGITNATATTKLGNIGIDYPIITSSSLSSGTLTLRGFVGSNPSGSTTFAGATLEFFIADNIDNDQNGEIIVGDLKSKPHGEGKTYIGSCTADANGLFGTVTNPCTLSNAVTSAMAVTDSITSTATDANGNTSEFSTPAVSNPNVLLVKRITAINGNTINGTVSLNSYDPDPTYPYDKNVIQPGFTPPTTDKWPGTIGASSSTFLLGARDGGITKPGDEVEYTIYFLSAGIGSAQRVQLCDRLPTNQAFVPNSYNFITPGPGVAPSVNADRGIALSYQSSLESYTNLADGDIAQYYPPGQVPLPDVCKTATNPNVNSNPTGAVLVNLGLGATGTTGGDLPSANDPSSTSTSYGFVRFKVKNIFP
jgi:trimeric autotransporter adhesin